MTRNVKHLLVVAAALAVTAGALQAQTAKDRIHRRGGTIQQVEPKREPGKFANPWPDGWEKGYLDRVNHYASHYKGKSNPRTQGEGQKWGLPETFGAFLAGDYSEAMEAMQARDAEAGSDHAWTRGIDYYWCFTLKGQAAKYFYWNRMLRDDYRKRMFEGGKAWTAEDPRPSLELVAALRSDDEVARDYALELLQQMWRSPEEVREMAEKAISEGHPNKKRFGEYMRKIADELPDEMPRTPEQWHDWWALIAAGDWMIFEEYERRTNPNPHPKYGRGTGPVGATWDPKVRGMRADARNTDNLRAMRECAVYLMAEETGNEKVRRLYKDKLKRNALTFWNIGNGEWDSEGYLGHTIAGYSNLYAYAKDPEVRGYAKALLDFLYLSAAHKYWRGCWGGPVKRDYGNCNPFSGTASLTGLHFGDAPMADPEPERDQSFMITCGYRPPAAIVALARKEFDRPVELLASHPTYQTWLPGNDEKPETFETMYYANTYQLGTSTRGHAYNTNGYKVLLWDKDQGAEYFIPSTGKGGNPVTAHAGGDNIGQFRNLTIWLNGKSGKTPFRFLVPSDVKNEDAGGVKFLRYQKTWIALRPVNLEFKGFSKWNSGRNRDGSLKLLEAQGTGGKVCGFVAEFGEQATHGSYGDFKKAVLSKGELDTSAVGEGVVAYTGAKGRQLKVAWQSGHPKVWRDGKAHDWTGHYKLFQPADGGKAPAYLGWKERKMHVEAGGHTYDAELAEDGTYTFESSVKD